jgi:hypothetical protein
MTYKYSGTLDVGERVTVEAIPLDENINPQRDTLRIRDELPRKIEFNFRK